MKETPVIAQGQMTPAVAAMLTKLPAGRKKVRRRKTTTRRAKPVARRRKTATKRAAPKGRLKKGSAAAKRRMAQLRAMKKRRR